MKRYLYLWAMCVILMLSANVRLVAQTVSAQEVLSNLNGKIGECIDMDNANGSQCVDLIKYVVSTYFGKNPYLTWGNADQLIYNNSSWQPNGTEVINSGFNPQPGDIFIFTGSSWGSVGHTGIIESVNGSTLYTLETNGEPAANLDICSIGGDPLKRYTRSVNSLNHIIRLPYVNCPGTTINIIGNIRVSTNPNSYSNTLIHGQNKYVGFTIKNISECTVTRSFKLYLTDLSNNVKETIWSKQITFNPDESKTYNWNTDTNLGGIVSTNPGNYRVVLKGGSGVLSDIDMSSSTVSCQTSDCNPVTIQITSDGTDDYYTIATSSSPSSGGTTSGDGAYVSGATRIVTATANSGYTFNNWTENGAVKSSNSSYTFTLTSNKNLVANFTYNGGVGGTCQTCPSYDFPLIPTTSLQTDSWHIESGGCYMYRISMEQGSQYTFKTGCGDDASADFDTQLFLYNSNCMQQNYDIDDADDGCENRRSKIENWICPSSGYYYLKVQGYDNNPNHYGNYMLAYKKTTSSTSPAPANDQCANATNLSCGATVSGTLTGATATTSVSYSDYSNKNDVFYYFTAANAGNYTITLSNFADDKDLFLYSSCSATTALAESSSSSSSEAITYTCTAGTTYRVRIIDYSGNGGTFSVSVTCPATPPTATPCDNVTNIAGNGSSYTKTATFSGSGSWDTNSCGYATPGQEKIYSFTPTTTGTYHLVVTSANGYVDYSWKSGNCSSSGWTCIGDINSSGTYAIGTLTAGTSYCFLLDSESSTSARTHSFYFELVTSPAPANDQCANATNLSCGANLDGTTVNTTAKTGNETANGTTNSSPYGVWYTFDGNGQQITLTSVAGTGFDHSMGIYSGLCGSLIHIITIDNNDSGGTETHTFYTVSGTKYYVYISHYSTSGSSTQTGTFTVSKTCQTLSNDATLSSLGVNGYSLYPSFNPNALVYNVTVENSVSSIAISATANHANANVSGAGAKSLNVGQNTFNIVVTAEDGTTQKTYTVVVTRSNPSLLSSDATLSSLGVNGYSLLPSFNPNTLVYNVTVENSVSSIAISATANHANANVSGAGAKSLNVGQNTFNIVVTAEDGTTQKAYTVVVTRSNLSLLSSDATLDNLTISEGVLSPSFSQYLLFYTAEVEINSIVINAVPSHPNATVSGTGNKTLMTGANPFDVLVTAEDGITTQTYNIAITLTNPVQTGIEDIVANQPVMYPNPAKDVLYIKGISEGAKIEVMDLSGRIVAQLIVTQWNGLIEINVSALPKGIYLVKSGSFAGKFVKL